MTATIRQTVRAAGGKGGVTVTFGNVETHTHHTITKTTSVRVVKGSGNRRGDSMTEGFTYRGRQK